jgi:hypothetical protein
MPSTSLGCRYRVALCRFSSVPACDAGIATRAMATCDSPKASVRRKHPWWMDLLIFGISATVSAAIGTPTSMSVGGGATCDRDR